jgi:serine/arginine repetitive matrix protein 2
VEPPASSKHPSRGPENGPTAPITAFRSQRGTQSASQPPSSSNAATSWRASAAPLPPLSPRRPSHSPVTTRVSFPSASQVLDVQLLDPSNDESLEEVEFNDLGKFVGVEPSPEETAPPPVQQADISTKDDRPRTKSEVEPFWRRKTSPAPPEEPSVVVSNTLPEASSESPASGEADTVPASPSMPTASIGAVSPAKSVAEGSLPGQTLVVPSSLPSQRSPRAPSYREEQLRSTFDDAMLRIKGAMQTKHHRNAMGTEHHPSRAAANNTSYSAERPRFGRGVPPGSRSHVPHVPEPDEPFTTMTELDVDVRRGQSNRVKLPPPRRAFEPPSKRDSANLKRSISPLRWDVLSWDPPVEGMSAKDYSVNGVLFDKPQLGHSGFLVKLPPSGSYLIKRYSPSLPKVHLPAKPLVNKSMPVTGAFGRPRAADESSTWRRTLPSIPDQVESTTSSEGLVTRTGSSPPDTDKASDVTPSVETETTQPAQLPIKFRAEPKMPAGAGVAFYRESTSCPSVSFTVSSELEDVRQLEAPVMPPPSEEPAPLSQPLGGPKGNKIDGSSTMLAPREKAESKSSDGSVSTIITVCGHLSD